MEDEFGLTQDCVEWIDENAADLVHRLNRTPAQNVSKKNYSPNQEIEELWKLLGTPSQQASQPLQRSNSVPLPRRHQRPRHPRNDDRKRKRPVSADGGTEESVERQEVNENSQSAAAGFEELLRQLDTPIRIQTSQHSALRPKAPLKCQKLSSSTMHSAKTTILPPRTGISSTMSLYKNPHAKKVPIQALAVQAFSKMSLPHVQAHVLPSIPHRKISVNVPTAQAMPLNLAHIQCKSNQSEIKSRNTSTGAVNEFNEFDFDFLSDSDLAALDTVVSSQTDVKGNFPLQAGVQQHNTCAEPVEEKLMRPPCVDPVTVGDDEFEDFNIDFDQLDVQIEQKLTNAKARAPRESFGDPFGDGFDFSELDESIASRKPDLVTKATKPAFHVDIGSLKIPPVYEKVASAQVRDHALARSTTSFTRYHVVAVEDDTETFTKAVLVKSWCKDVSHDDKIQVTLHRPSTTNKILTQEKQQTIGEGWIFLRGEWYHTPIQSGDSINICSLSGRYQTNLEALPMILHTNAPPGSDAHDDLFLVLHPDTLLPPTMISEVLSCSRRAVLRWRLGSTGISNKAALYGTMRHLLFEKCMNHQDFSIDFATDSVLAIVRQTAENLVALGITEGEAQKEVIRIMPQLQRFRKDYIGENGTTLKKGKVDGNGVNPDQKFIARSVESTEELLVSPEFGLKGNVDVTVKATTEDVSSPFIPNPAGAETGIVGIELKTGHNQTPQNAHMAQLALYTLMLSVQYGRSSDGHSSVNTYSSKSGMLLYMNHEGMRAVRVSPLLQELKSLIGRRNVLACDIKKVSTPRGVKIVYEDEREKDLEATYIIESAPSPCLPEVLSGPQPCNRCYSNRECMVYAAAELSIQTEGYIPTIKTSHSKLLAHFCGHLDDEDLRYFNEWDRLIDLEAHATAKHISASWLSPSYELEISNGRSISSLVLDEHFAPPRQDEDGSEWVPIAMFRSSDAESKEAFSHLNLEPGSLVVVSVDVSSPDMSSEENRKLQATTKRHTMYIARGSIQTLEDSRIVVKVSAQESRQLSREVKAARARKEILKLRLDRDDVQTGLGTTRQNLINLLSGDVKPFENSKADPKLSQNLLARNRYERLRKAVIKLQPPQYDARRCYKMFHGQPFVDIPGCDIKCLQRDFDRLNNDQQEAARMIFSANDYSLVQGLPGTGKSSTIAFVARLFAAHGKRVLITSYTHAAVDNLMMKLIEGGMSALSESDGSPRIIRIGKKESSHPAVHPILLSEAAMALLHKFDKESSSPSSDALQKVLANARIVGVTTLSIPRSSVLVGQEFDVVIVDEAGQINQPTILGALMAADTFVLVGDHKQLPPLVTSEVAEKAGFGVSMLSRLADTHSGCVAQLTLQYRMHEDICQICNEIVYAGKLKCANEAVKYRALTLNKYKASDSWVSRIINPARPVVFADTDFFDRYPTNQKVTNQLVGLERRPEKSGRGNMVNDREVSIVGRVIGELVESGLLPSSIGVISPFRAQVRQLDESEAISKWKACGLEISTIDRFQGRDKPVMIISFVRSNSKGYSGRLLNDFRRLNVAVSRAMCKLILVGSFSTLHSGSGVLRPVLDGFRERKQIEKIPEHVLRSQLT